MFNSLPLSIKSNCKQGLSHELFPGESAQDCASVSGARGTRSSPERPRLPLVDKLASQREPKEQRVVLLSDGTCLWPTVFWESGTFGSLDFFLGVEHDRKVSLPRGLSLKSGSGGEGDFS